MPMGKVFDISSASREKEKGIPEEKIRGIKMDILFWKDVIREINDNIYWRVR